MIEKYVNGMLEAYNFRPSRAEPLHDLATYFREQGKNALAVMFAEAAMTIPLSKDSLFVETPSYTWGPRREFAIAAYYDDHRRSRGYEVCDGLITDAAVPDWVREEARRNMFFYLSPLSSFCKSATVTPITPVAWTPPERYSLTNPCIARFHRLTYACVRAVNYRIREDGSYDMQGDDAIRTRNYLVLLNEKQRWLSVNEIVWERP